WVGVHAVTQTEVPCTAYWMDTEAMPEWASEAEAARVTVPLSGDPGSVMATMGAVLSMTRSRKTAEETVFEGFRTGFAVARRSYTPLGTVVVSQSEVQSAEPSRFRQPSRLFQSSVPATAYSNRTAYRPSRLAFSSAARRVTLPRSTSPGSVRMMPKWLPMWN